MVRCRDLDASSQFYVDICGLREIRRQDNEAGRFTLMFLATDEDQSAATGAPCLELTYNWDTEEYLGGRNFGQLAFEGDDGLALLAKKLATATALMTELIFQATLWFTFGDRYW